MYKSGSIIYLLILPLIFTSLYSDEVEEVQELSPEVVQSLYLESALFVAVFAIMPIVSIVISKKHAAQNLLNDQKKRAERKVQEREKESQKSLTKDFDKTKRVKELSKMLKDGLITDDEFKILSHAPKV